MSNPYAGVNPWPGNWQSVFLPGHLWESIASGSPDPASPGNWSNYWNPRFQMRGKVFDNPTGVNPDPATIHYDLLLPPYIKHNRNTALNYDYACGLHWWTSGDLSILNVTGDVTIAPYGMGTALGTVGPVSLPFLCTACPASCMGINPWSVSWVSGVAIPESNAVHLTVARLPNNVLGIDTYNFEWFFIGLLFCWKAH